MIVEIKRKHRGPLPKQRVGEYTEFSRAGESRFKECCIVFGALRTDGLIEFSHSRGAYFLYNDNHFHKLNFCSFCGEKIQYKLVSNIEVVEVKEKKRRTVPNMVQDGFREEEYEETHFEERENINEGH